MLLLTYLGAVSLEMCNIAFTAVRQDSLNGLHSRVVPCTGLLAMLVAADLQAMQSRQPVATARHAAYLFCWQRLI